jgi:hypothetical protein
MSDNQQGQSNQGLSGQGPSSSGSQSKGAPVHPPATPPNQRTNTRNDGADGSKATKG